MQTVLVVEDEKLIRQGIATMIKRSGVPVEEVIECSNGLQAMDVLRTCKVDVMFTDIRMPKMNGIELVQAMQEVNNPPITIAVSGYDDFSYAVEMMRQGVREYILKPVEREKIREILKKLEEEIQKTREEEKETESEQIKLLKYLLQDRDATEEEMVSLHRRFRAELGETYYVCATPMLEEDPESDKILEVKDLEDSDVFLVGEKGLQEVLRLSEETACFTGISDLHREPEELKTAYTEAKKRRQRAFCMGGGPVRAEGNRVPEELLRKGEELVSRQALSAIVQKLGTDRVEELHGDFEKIFVAVERGQIPPEKMTEGIRVFGEEFLNFYRKELAEGLRRPYRFSSLKEYKEALYGYLKTEHEALTEKNREDQTEGKIRQAVLYIQEHFRENLNMAVVSNEISMNYSLFSSAFKTYTGTNFVNFLRDLRMEEAKKLLTETDLKVNEISVKIGYDNEKHFMKSFRASVGVTPGEYRKNAR